MAEIHTTAHFTVEAPEQPHIDRSDGGHLIIRPQRRVTSRQALSRRRRS